MIGNKNIGLLPFVLPYTAFARESEYEPYTYQAKHNPKCRFHVRSVKSPDVIKRRAANKRASKQRKRG